MLLVAGGDAGRASQAGTSDRRQFLGPGDALLDVADALKYSSSLR